MDDNINMGYGWIWVFLIIAVLFGGGFGFGGNNAAAAGYATQQDITNAINAQTSAINQQQLLMQGATQNYETSRLISDQNFQMMTQNNTNLVNAIQGFNAVNANVSNLFNNSNLAMMNGFNTVASKLDGIVSHMDECCCSIKGLIKDNQIASLQLEVAKLQNEAVNTQQSLYLIEQLGGKSNGSST